MIGNPSLPLRLSWHTPRPPYFSFQLHSLYICYSVYFLLLMLELNLLVFSKYYRRNARDLNLKRKFQVWSPVDKIIKNFVIKSFRTVNFRFRWYLGWWFPKNDFFPIKIADVPIPRTFTVREIPVTALPAEIPRIVEQLLFVSEKTHSFKLTSTYRLFGGVKCCVMSKSPLLRMNFDRAILYWLKNILSLEERPFRMCWIISYNLNVIPPGYQLLDNCGPN